jgi:hypothetical protein
VLEQLASELRGDGAHRVQDWRAAELKPERGLGRGQPGVPAQDPNETVVTALFCSIALDVSEELRVPAYFLYTSGCQDRVAAGYSMPPASRPSGMHRASLRCSSLRRRRV